MNPLKLLDLPREIDLLSSSLSLAARIGIPLGAAVILVYSRRIGHLPQELTLGDGLIFLFVAFCFGLTYVVFVAGVTSLGVVALPLVKMLLRVFQWWATWRTGVRPEPQYELPRPNALHYLFASLGLLILLLMAWKDRSAIWSVAALPLVQFSIYSSHVILMNKLSGTIAVEDEGSKVDRGETRYYAKASLAALLAMPILMGGVTGQLLDGAMRFAHIRVDNVTVYVKQPYAALVPAPTNRSGDRTPEGFVRVDDADILFQHLGQTKLIEFASGDRKKKLEVPNDHIIVF